MADNNQKHALTKTWAILAGMCGLVLFALFAVFGEPGKGEAAAVICVSLITAIRYFWDRRLHAWFWITIVMIGLLNVPLIALIDWPFQRLTYVALLPAALLDFGLAYGVIRLVEISIAKSRVRPK